jgi:hypothetical protein
MNLFCSLLASYFTACVATKSRLSDNATWNYSHELAFEFGMGISTVKFIKTGIHLFDNPGVYTYSEVFEKNVEIFQSYSSSCSLVGELARRMRTLNSPFFHNYALIRLFGEILLQYKYEKSKEKITIKYDKNMKWKYVDEKCPNAKLLHDKMISIGTSRPPIHSKRKRISVNDDDHYEEGRENEDAKSSIDSVKRAKRRALSNKRERKVNKEKSLKRVTTSKKSKSIDDCDPVSLDIESQEQTILNVNDTLVAHVTTTDLENEYSERTPRPFSAWSANRRPVGAFSSLSCTNSSSSTFQAKLDHILSTRTEACDLCKPFVFPVPAPENTQDAHDSSEKVQSKIVMTESGPLKKRPRRS